ncbi:MAG: apolipoprotein N-acyltransferase [Prevotellaceae bacterium]|jgi:apolipoprotein N-acyltransferase|nr:apolipoprotein N-acyltransferase [Prevotellaceae bacterium]
MNMRRHLLLSLLSAVMLALPWYTPFSGMLLWVAFVPLLALEHDFALRKARGCWKYYALTFIVWNAITTYWLSHATLAGAVGAIIGNALQMFLLFALFRWVKRKTNNATGYTFLVALWLAWEYFYFDAEISWPWLVLGNGFAKDIHLIQWYEYTGVLGGSLWVWLVNLVLFHIITARRTIYKKQRAITLTIAGLLIMAPITLSLIRFHTYRETINPCRVAILQPNIDPYHEKFNGLSGAEQLAILLSLAETATDSLTDYVIAPETAIDRVQENAIEQSEAVRAIRGFVARRPQVNFITGVTSLYFYSPDEKRSVTAREIENGAYDVFNASMQINRTDSIPVYHKSKLVLLVEKMPYPRFFSFLKSLSLDLGGYVGSYGTQEEREAFPSADGRFRIGTAICYESVYGRYYTEYIRKGANLMSIITNDGWWDDTPGYRQHLTYASLRAIETRRSIARSANTGISAIINQRGEASATTGWWERTSLSGTLNANEHITFYVRYGDYTGRAACLTLFLIGGYALVRGLLKKRG